jgi:quaternary ammonium compound-resistance protein SugE
MAWIMLVIAGFFEIGFALSLKASNGFTRPLPTLLFAITGATSFFLLTQALRTLPVGVAYAVWTGIGAAGTAIIGMLVLGESRDLPKLIALAALIGGIIGLRLTGGEH